MKRIATIIPLVLAASAALAGAQTLSAPAPEKGSGVISTPLSLEAKAVLQALQDRKATLKDFTANVDYGVENPRTGDLDGKLGTINYTDDGTVTRFAFDFTFSTVEGKPNHKIHDQLISDGTKITAIDYDAKQFHQFVSPGPTNSLKSPIPIPIGIKIEEITDNFNVEMQPAGKDPNLVTLRLKPLRKGTFDYAQLDLTVDKTLNIPVKIIATAAGDGAITTVKFNEPAINTGKAVIPAVTIPAAGTGWGVDLGTPTTAPAPATMPAK